MSRIIIIEPGAISEADKKKLEKSDFVVIESETPDKIKVLGSLDVVGNDEMLNIALKACSKYEPVYATFGRELCNAIIRKTEQPAPKP